jgi:hypothetical protein
MEQQCVYRRGRGGGGLGQQKLGDRVMEDTNRCQGASGAIQ